MTKGAFYNTFKSKENFLLSCLKVYAWEHIQRIKDMLSPKENITAIKTLENFFSQVLECQASTNYSGCLIGNTMSELSGNNATIRDAINVHFKNWLWVIEPTVKQAQKEWQIHSRESSEKITELLSVAFLWVLSRVKSLQETSQGKETMKLLIDSLSP
jgi:AcrR family transcriptional regulator